MSEETTIDAAVEALLAPPKADKAEAEQDDRDDTPVEGDKLEDEDDGPDDGQADDEDEEPADEAEDEDEQADEASSFVGNDAKVKLEDGTVVTVNDLISQRMLRQDHTRKTQELSEERKKVRDAQSQVDGYAEQILRQLETAKRLADLAKPAFPQIDPNEDPMGYLLIKERYTEAMREWEQHVAEVNAGIDATLKQRDTHKSTLSAEELEANRAKLRQAIPEIDDPAKRDNVLKAIFSAAQSVGFTPDELKAMTDHRIVQLAHMAARAQKLEQAAPKAKAKVEGAPPVQKPGARPSAKQARKSEYRTARNRLAQTGSRADAVDAILKGGLI